jgi:hypothetical protein
MPVTADQVTVTYHLLPLTLTADGCAEVTVRRFMTHADGTQELVDTKNLSLSQTEAATLLGAQPTAGKIRKDDLSDAVYALLIARGDIKGTIS